jgi:hypothetical protein
LAAIQQQPRRHHLSTLLACRPPLRHSRAAGVHVFNLTIYGSPAREDDEVVIGSPLREDDGQADCGSSADDEVYESS